MRHKRAGIIYILIFAAAFVVSSSHAARQKINIPGAPRRAESIETRDLKRPDHASSPLSGIELGSISDALRMDGVAGFVEGRARQAIGYALSKEGGKWICDSIARAINSKKSGEKSIDIVDLIKQDEALRLEVKENLKARIKDWLPGQVKDAIVNDLFGGIVGEKAAREVQEIADRVVREINLSFNDRIDAAASQLYDSAIYRLKQEMSEKGISRWVDIGDLRGSIDRVLDSSYLGNMAADEIAKLVGDGTVAGIRGRLTDVLGGTLPPEVIESLKAGPEALDRYIAEYGSYLPGAQLGSLTTSALNTPIFRLPTPAYASILAASAAGHFARAFSGVYVDPYELKRGVEVTRVMVWQIQNKDGISLSLMQLGNLARGLASSLGAGDALGSLMDKLTAPIDRIQELADRIDGMLLKPFKEVSAELKSLAAQIQGELEALQDVVMGPLKGELENMKGWIDDGLAAAKFDLEEKLPDGFNGIPGSWDEAKEVLGLPDDLFGEVGDLRPRDLLEEAARKSGLDEVAAKVKEDLEELNDAVADAASEAASQALHGLHLIGPAAEILDVERVPARNPSDESALDPVLLHNGEYFQNVTDMVIPGRGLDYRFTRTYRGRSDFLGELGWRWTHSFAERLRPWNDGVTYVDGEGRKFYFRREGEAYLSPSGLDLTLTPIPEGGHILKAMDGTMTSFDRAGRPARKCDIHKNCISYRYGEEGLLKEIVDVLGRRIVFSRRNDGLLKSFTDFAGRTMSFEYNDAQELIGVTSPASIDFPKSKKTSYRYNGGQKGDPAHLITMIMDPRGHAWLSLRYDGQGRVTKQRWGDGPWMTVRYAKGEGDVASRTWVTDQLGVTRCYEHDSAGHLLRRWVYEGGEYELLESYLYNENGEVRQRCLPSRRCTVYEYSGEDAGPARIIEYPAGGGGPRITGIDYEPLFGRIAEIAYPAGIVERAEYSKDGSSNLIAIYRKTSGESEWSRIAGFSYDPFGQVTGETDARGVTTSFEYYPASDPDGDGISLEAVGKLEGGGYLRRVVVDALQSDAREVSSPPVKSTRTFEYDAVGNIIAATDPLGNRTTYLVNSLNQVLEERRPGMWPIKYSFDANDNLKSGVIGRPTGAIEHSFEYGELDKLVVRREQVSEGSFAVTRYEYDASGNLISTVKPEGNSIEYEYDNEGRLMCAVHGDASLDRSRECVERNDDGNVIAYIDGSGIRTRYELDGFGENVASIDAVGDRTEYARDAAGRIVGVRRLNPDGKLLAEERRSYDGDLLIEVSRRLWKSDPEKSRWLTTKYEYDGAGNLVGETDPLGARTEFMRDGLGEVVSIQNPDEMRRTFERDAAGRVVKSYVVGDGAEYELATYSYNAAGVVAAFNRGWAMPWRYERDGLGRLNRLVNPAGETVDYSFDDLGRTTAVALGEGIEEKYEWDLNGRLVAVVGAGGNRTEYGYDGLDRPILERYADGSKRRLTYDGAGRVTGVLRRDGGAIAIQYDRAGRLSRRSARVGEKRAEQRFEHDGMGRLVMAVDGSRAVGPAVTRIRYDSLSRPFAESMDEIWLLRTFDDSGRIVSMVYPGGESYQRTYTADGLLKSILGKRGRLASFERNAAGQMVKTSLAARISLGVERDRWGRELGRGYEDANGKVVAEWKFARDALGRIAREEDSLTKVTSRYARNESGRLARVDEDGGEDWRYQFDPAGNILRESHGTEEMRLSYNSLNQVDRAVKKDNSAGRHDTIPAGSYDYEYDGGGRLIGDGLWRLEYDAWGRLEQVYRGTERFAWYSYDAFNRRIHQWVADIGHKLTWDGWRLARVEAVNDKSRDFVYGEGLGAPLLSIAGGFSSVLIMDQLGSVRGIDGAENDLSARCDYSPYGRGLGCDHFAGFFGFAGQARGIDGRFTYMRYRDYDPYSMRFVEPDPFGIKMSNHGESDVNTSPALSYHIGQGLTSGASIPNRPLVVSATYGAYPFNRLVVSAAAPHYGELNLYQYASGDPSYYLDPFGLASLVLDRSVNRMKLVEDNGWELTEYHAANRTTNPDGNPRAIGKHAPVPEGTFALGVPQFYSEEYRQEFYERFGLGEIKEGESKVVSYKWDGTWENGYNISQGRIRMRIGAPTTGLDLLAWRRQLFIHGGRNNNYRSRTYGCIRARDDELETLAANFISFRRHGDPIDELVVK